MDQRDYEKVLNPLLAEFVIATVSGKNLQAVLEKMIELEDVHFVPVESILKERYSEALFDLYVSAYYDKSGIPFLAKTMQLQYSALVEQEISKRKKLADAFEKAKDHPGLGGILFANPDVFANQRRRVLRRDKFSPEIMRIFDRVMRDSLEEMLRNIKHRELPVIGRFFASSR